MIYDRELSIVVQNNGALDEFSFLHYGVFTYLTNYLIIRRWIPNRAFHKIDS